jgi:hypothetical protein
MWDYARGRSIVIQGRGARLLTIGGRARLGIIVSLGILAGIGVVGLPGLLITPTQSATAPTTATNSTSGYLSGMSYNPTTLNDRSNTTRTLPAGDTEVTPGSLAALISLVVAPAVAVSLVASVLVSKRTGRKRASPLSDKS